jgi:hypothetical protein
MKNDELKQILGELDLYRFQKQLGEKEYGPVPVAIGDLFACGCYFIQQGKKELGFKLCRTALLVYEIDSTLIDRILKVIEGEEYEIAQLLNPHVEIPDWLFNCHTN